MQGKSLRKRWLGGYRELSNFQGDPQRVNLIHSHQRSNKFILNPLRPRERRQQPISEWITPSHDFKAPIHTFDRRSRDNYYEKVYPIRVRVGAGHMFQFTGDRRISREVTSIRAPYPLKGWLNPSKVVARSFVKRHNLFTRNEAKKFQTIG